MGAFGGKGRLGSAPSRSGSTLVLSMDDRVLYEVDPASISGKPLLVGRSRECDWCTAGIDSTLSSSHAEIVRRRSSVWIRDLGSRNGMFFKGERVKEHRFAVGDTVLLGACKIVLERDRRTVASESGTSAHRLEQVSGPESGRTFELTGNGDVVMGSDPGSDVFLADTLVSRRHAKLVVKKDGSCWISDLGSRNGTMVNGVPLAKDKERMLRDGDIVSAADAEFRFLDKSAIHADTRIGRMAFTAGATAVAGIVVFAIWNAGRITAPTLLSRAQDAAARWTPDSMEPDFAFAFGLLERASEAPRASVYATDTAEQRSKMEGWTNTIACWREVRRWLADGRPVAAVQFFHGLSSWTWNADTAPAAGREAEAAQKAVSAFLSSRRDLTDASWEGGAETGVFAADADVLSAAIAELPDADWTVPLRSEAVELLEELRRTTNVVAMIAGIPESILPGPAGDPPPDAARRALAAVEAAKSSEEAHRARREAELADERNFPWRGAVFHAPVADARIESLREPLRALAGSEAHVQSNVVAAAAGDWAAISRTIPFPSRAVTDVRPEFKRYREWLEEKNGCVITAAEGFRTRVEALERAGFGAFASTRVPAFDELFDPGALRSALRFVAEDTPVPRRDSDAPVDCALDRYAGVWELGDFVVAVADGVPVSRAADEYDAAWRGRPWKSVVERVREALVPLRRLRDYPESEITGAARVIAAATPPDGRSNRCADSVMAASDLLSALSDWTFETLQDVCRADGSDRAEIFSEAVSLLLADPSGPGRSQTKSAAGRLSELWLKHQATLREIDAGAETDPDGSSRKVLSCGFPSDTPPFKSAWRDLRGMEDAR